MLVTTEPIRRAYNELKDRGVKVRFITEITNNNIDYSKELLKIVNEVCHLDGVHGNLSPDRRSNYLRRNCNGSGKTTNRTTCGKRCEGVGTEQYFFEMLWSQAILAKQRIKEIKEHAKREFMV